MSLRNMVLKMYKNICGKDNEFCLLEYQIKTMWNQSIRYDMKYGY